MPPDVIDSDSQLTEAAARLRGAPSLAIDTESASFHRYVDRVYLIQISSTAETILIDPLAVEDLSPVGVLLEDAETEIVFHDADYDLRTLDRDYGFRAARLFDTRVAAQLAGEPGVGLAALLEKYFRVNLNKKLQRTDWSARPLTEDMIKYAADDTRYLIDLKELLRTKLESLGRLAWAEEEFERLEDVRWTGSTDEDAYLRVKGSRKLTPRQRAILRAVYEWRDAKALEMDRAPFRVLTNAVLAEIAKNAPTAPNELKRISGLPRTATGRWAGDILEAVQTALGLPPDQLPTIKRRTRQQHDAAYDKRLDQLKELRNRRATEEGIDPGLLCPNGTLQAIARESHSSDWTIEAVPELRRWQREALGEAAIVAATTIN